MTDYGRQQIIILIEDGKTASDEYSWYSLGLLHGIRAGMDNVNLQVLVDAAQSSTLIHNNWQPLLDTDVAVSAAYQHFKSGGH